LPHVQLALGEVDVRPPQAAQFGRAKPGEYRGQDERARAGASRLDDGTDLGGKRNVDSDLAIGRPKTAAGERVVPLTPKLVAVLREWRLACPNGQLDLVFPNTDGKVDWHSNIISRCWRISAFTRPSPIPPKEPRLAAEPSAQPEQMKSVFEKHGCRPSRRSTSFAVGNDDGLWHRKQRSHQRHISGRLQPYGAHAALDHGRTGPGPASPRPRHCQQVGRIVARLAL
jgi:hypothetical protein